jgi:ABC-type branched-subunit amino acid transport system substrate-binding protein
MGSMRRVAIVVTVSCVLALGTPLSVDASTRHAAAKKGDPVTIMTIGEFEVAVAGSANPEVSGAVRARAKAINQAGGLKDASGTTHKLKVDVCNTNNDPNKAEQCARKAVDEGVAAVVGTYTTYGSSIYPILTAANIPVIGSTGSEPTPFTSPNSFTTNSGLPGIFINMPAYLAGAGAKKLSLVFPDLAAAAGITPLIVQAAQAAGATVVNQVTVPLDAADLAPQVSAATANDADGIIVVVIGDQNGRFLQGLQQEGYNGKIATAGPFLTPQILNQLGDYLNGKTLLELSYPPTTATSVPGIRQFNKNMNAFDKSLSKNDQAVGNWLSTYVFEQAAAQVSEVTGPNLLTALNAMTNVDTLGLTPPINFTQPVKVTQFPLPRLFNDTVVHGVLKKGKIVSKSKPPEFVNAFG